MAGMPSEKTTCTSLGYCEQRGYLWDFYKKTLKDGGHEYESFTTHIFKNWSSGFIPESKEGEDEEEILLKLTILENLVRKQKNVPATLLSTKMIKNMIQMMNNCSSSPYISYSACKCLKAVLRHVNVKVMPSIIMDICQNIKDTELHYVFGNSHLLDVLCSLFSKKDTRTDLEEDELIALFHTIARELRSLIGIYMSQSWTLTNPDSSEIPSFLTLWNKIVKYQLRMEENNLHYLEDSVNWIKPVTLLFDNLLKKETCPRFILQKVFQIINNCLQYSVIGAGGKTKGSRQLRKYILDKNIDALFDMIPKTCVAQSFGGNCDIKEHPESVRTCTLDVTSYRKLVLIILKSIAISLQPDDMEDNLNIEEAINKLVALHSHVQKHFCNSTKSTWLFIMYGDQDDQLTEAMLCLLAIIMTYHRLTPGGQILHQDSEAVKDCLEDLDPNIIFLDFLSHTAWDYSLILDLLTSPETCFLAYLLKYLRFCLSQWQCFIQVCQSYNSENITESQSVSTRQKKTVHDCSQQANESETPVKRLKLTEYTDSESEQSEDLDCESLPVDIIHDSTRPGVSLPMSTCSLASNISGESCKTTKTDSNDLVQTDFNNSGTNSCQDMYPNQNVSYDNALMPGESQNSVTLDSAMSVLIRLNLAIHRLVSKGLFPYNPKPLIKLLDKCEDLYEN